MKKSSIRLRITLWFTAMMTVIALLCVLAEISINDSAMQKILSDNLIETVTVNLDNVEFSALDQAQTYAQAGDLRIAYKNGYLLIDDDYLDVINGIRTALYDETGNLLYGENPAAKATIDIPFSDSTMTEVSVAGTEYYVYDMSLAQEGWDDLWLRGTVSKDQGRSQISYIARLSFALAPAVIILAAVGGYLLAGRFLRPIKKITQTAHDIRTSRDLARRISIGKGSDELHALADEFDMMFDRLQEDFEAERQLTSDISHELRTPLSVIHAQCELSLETEQSKEEYEDAIQTIYRQSKRMSNIVNDMLSATRLERNLSQTQMTELNMSELTQSLCRDLAALKQNGIEMQYHIQPGIQVQGNAELLSRLMSNLIMNAYKYGRQNGHIQVQLISEGNTAELSVSDDGVGISSDDIDKIWRRYYRADKSRTTESTGLGLFIVKKIAEVHRGTLEVRSQPGQGSTFIFKIPKK